MCSGGVWGSPGTEGWRCCLLAPNGWQTTAAPRHADSVGRPRAGFKACRRVAGRGAAGARLLASTWSSWGLWGLVFPCLMPARKGTEGSPPRTPSPRGQALVSTQVCLDPECQPVARTPWVTTPRPPGWLAVSCVPAGRGVRSGTSSLARPRCGRAHKAGAHQSPRQMVILWAGS